VRASRNDQPRLLAKRDREGYGPIVHRLGSQKQKSAIVRPIKSLRVIRQNRRCETDPYFFSSLHRADRPQAADQDTQKLQNLASLESNRQFCAARNISPLKLLIEQPPSGRSRPYPEVSTGRVRQEPDRVSLERAGRRNRSRRVSGWSHRQRSSLGIKAESSRQSVPNCISPRPTFASVSFRTCALERVASVGFDLSERGHWRAPPSSVLQAELLASMSGSRAAVPSWDTSVAVAVPLIRVCCHNLSATGIGSTESLPHHAASSPWR
jgi:hypothetical protein